MRIPFIFLLFLSVHCLAQNSLLYKVSGKGLEGESYLFGTAHVKEERAFSFNEEVFNAIDATETAAFELDLREFKSLTSEIDTQMIFDLTDYLFQDFIPELMAKIPPAELGARIGSQMAPLFMQISQMRLGMDNRSMFVDQYLQTYADYQDKNIVGIETFSEQIEAILGSNYSNFTDKMIEFLMSDDWSGFIHSYIKAQEQIIEAYSSLNYNQLCNTLMSQLQGDSDTDNTSEYYQRMILNRNEIMLKRGLALMKEQPTFIAVGAGHLCGEQGLVNQLRQKGLKVEAINIEEKQENSISEWKHIENDKVSMVVPKASYNVIQKYYYMPRTMHVTPGRIREQTIFTTNGLISFYVLPLQTVKNVSSEDNEAAGIAEEEVEETYEIYEYRGNEPMVIEEIEVIDEPEHTGRGELADNNTEQTNSNAIRRHVEPMITPEMKLYFDSLGSAFKEGALDSQSDLMSNAMSGMMNSEIDSFQVNIMGQEYTAIRTFSRHGNYVACDVELENGIHYQLMVTGDPAALKSDDWIRFFESFVIKDF